jgi:hypothetical protein
VVLHACNPSTQEVEAEGLRAQSQPELHSEVQPRLGYIESSCFKIPTPSKKKKNKKEGRKNLN